MSKREGGSVSWRLMTEVNRIEYHCDSQVGTVYMEEGCCADMEGAIQLFMSIDSGVQKIITIAGAAPDTTYVRISTSEWEARPAIHSAKGGRRVLRGETGPG